MFWDLPHTSHFRIPSQKCKWNKNTSIDLPALSWQEIYIYSADIVKTEFLHSTTELSVISSHGFFRDVLALPNLFCLIFVFTQLIHFYNLKLFINHIFKQFALVSLTLLDHGHWQCQFAMTTSCGRTDGCLN